LLTPSPYIINFTDYSAVVGKVKVTNVIVNIYPYAINPEGNFMLITEELSGILKRKK
jgi:hypothetical protein